MKEQMVSGIVRSSRQPRDSQTLSLLQGHVGKVLYTELTDVSVAMTVSDMPTTGSSGSHEVEWSTPRTRGAKRWLRTNETNAV